MSRSCEVIVIESDDEVDDRKPAAKLLKPSAAKKAAASTNNNNNNTTTNSSCISLLEEESSDDENPGRISHNVHNKRNKRKRPYHDNNNSNNNSSQSSQRSTTLVSDRELAEQLQRNEELGSQKSSAIDVEKCMSSTTDGKAWLLVQEMLTLIKSAKEQFISENKSLKHYCVEAVAVDDMVYMATDMLEKQNEFVKSGVCGYIDTGELFSFSCVGIYRILACVYFIIVQTRNECN